MEDSESKKSVTIVTKKTARSTPRREVAKPVPPNVAESPVPRDCKSMRPTNAAVSPICIISKTIFLFI